MARTHEGDKLTEEHRQQQVALAAKLSGEVSRLFARIVRWDDLDSSSEEFARQAAGVVGRYREASRMLSVDYIKAFRAVEAPDSPVPIEEPDDMDAGSIVRSLLATVRGVLKNLSRKGYGESEAMDRGKQSVVGKATKLAGDGGRQVLETEVRRGTGPIGYARVVDADPCPFCAMLASRGLYLMGEEADGALLYRSDSFVGSSARFIGDGRFKVHDHCCCTMEPVYKRDGKINLPGNGNDLAKEWAQVASGQDDPWLSWQRWRQSGTLPENYDGPLDGTRRPAPAHGQSSGRRNRPKPQKASERGVSKDSAKGGKSRHAGTWDRQRYLDYASELDKRVDGIDREIADLKSHGQSDDDVSVLALVHERRQLVSRIARYRKQADKM